jgi:DNA-binding protein H-NS
MATYKELVQQRESLEKQIAEARHRETSDAVSQVHTLIAEFGLTQQDIFPSGKSAKSGAIKTGAKVAPKYRNPATQETWTGRGKAPKWIEGQERAQFLII